MPQRRQLPPQIRRIELASLAKGKHVIQLTVDVGIVDAKGKQIQRRYATEQQSRDELAKIRGGLVKGTCVRPRSVSVATVVNWGLSGPAGREATTAAVNRHYTTRVIDALDDVPAHELVKAHIDQLLSQFVESTTAPGRKRLAFGAGARGEVFATLPTVLEIRARNSSPAMADQSMPSARWQKGGDLAERGQPV
jgi:integrase